MKNCWSNNPTAFQFYYTFKRLMLKHNVKNVKGNCLELDNTQLIFNSDSLISSELSMDNISFIKKYSIDINDLISNTEDFHGIIKFIPSVSDLSENPVAYVAGFVVKSLKKIVRCEICNSVLECLGSSTNIRYFKLLNAKNWGQVSGLVKPSKDVVKICYSL